MLFIFHIFKILIWPGGEIVSYLADIVHRGTRNQIPGSVPMDICVLKLLFRARLQHGLTVLCILDDPQSSVNSGLQCCTEISRDISVDQVVCLMGYPINTHPNLNANWGKIERCDNSDSIIVDIFSGPGNSGGNLFANNISYSELYQYSNVNNKYANVFHYCVGPLFDLSGRLLGVSAQSLTTILSCNTIISPISGLIETIHLLT